MNRDRRMRDEQEGGGAERDAADDGHEYGWDHTHGKKAPPVSRRFAEAFPANRRETSNHFFGVTLTLSKNTSAPVWAPRMPVALPYRAGLPDGSGRGSSISIVYFAGSGWPRGQTLPRIVAVLPERSTTSFSRYHSFAFHGKGIVLSIRGSASQSRIRSSCLLPF